METDWLEADQPATLSHRRLRSGLPAVTVCVLGLLSAGAGVAQSHPVSADASLSAPTYAALLPPGHEVLGAAATGQLNRWVLVRAGPPIGFVPIEVLRSGDRGRSWLATSVTRASGVQLVKFAFSDSLHGVLVLALHHNLNERDTYETGDGGAHWVLLKVS
jgi:hypothetical protein